MRRIIAAVLLIPWLPALAQESASYKLEGSVFNASGHPGQGTVLTSASYRIQLDASGEGVTVINVASASFQMEGGLVGAYPPPDEVRDLKLASDQQTLTWDPEASVGTYDVYRDLIEALPGTFGACLQSGLTANSAVDLATPTVGHAYYYLVTARNRLAEEGTKGYDSTGIERGNPAPCP